MKRTTINALMIGTIFGMMTTTAAYARKKKAEPLPPAELGLVDNINGISVGADGRLVQFTGLLIDKEGRVEKRLIAGDKRPEHLRFKMDAKGRTLIPSFVDGHARLIPTGIAQLTLDLSDTRSMADVMRKVAAETGGRKWILGHGWDVTRWTGSSVATPTAEASLPTATDLDAAVSAIPVWLESADGETGWANSLAMKQAGITATTKAPVGGRIHIAGGKPTGIFTGTAMNLIRAVAPAPAPKDRDVALDKAQPLFLAAGISSISDMGMLLDDWQALRRAGDRGALRLRVSGYADSISDMIHIAGPAPSPWLYDGKLRLVGVSFALDGHIPSRTAWLKAPYADTPQEKGMGRVDSTRLRNQMSRAAMDGFQIALSAHGDAAVAEALYAIEELAATYEGDRRWRIEGADVIAPNDLGDINKQGALITVRPLSLSQNAATAQRRLGEGRPYLPLGTISSGAGTRLAFGSWAEWAVPSPFLSISAAMGYVGDTEGTTSIADGERLGFAQALAAVTRNPAYAMGAEKHVGALEPGQWADFLLIDQDISTATPDAIARTKVQEHWMAGKRAWTIGETSSVEDGATLSTN